MNRAWAPRLPPQPERGPGLVEVDGPAQRSLEGGVNLGAVDGLQLAELQETIHLVEFLPQAGVGGPEPDGGPVSSEGPWSDQLRMATTPRNPAAPRPASARWI